MFFVDFFPIASVCGNCSLSISNGRASQMVMCEDLQFRGVRIEISQSGSLPSEPKDSRRSVSARVRSQIPPAPTLQNKTVQPA